MRMAEGILACLIVYLILLNNSELIKGRQGDYK